MVITNTKETTTLNLIFPYLINLRLSEKDILNENFDYNKNPLEPPGTKVVV